MPTESYSNSGLDTANPNYAGSLPPYGAANCCVNASIQFYSPDLTPIGHNIRLSQHTFDPQLNAPHADCAACETTFVSTYDDGTNHANDQQQIVAQVTVP